ncbi:MAG: MIP/aquaporin family protein [bacterium]
MPKTLAQRCVAEAIGTWAIVFFGCGAIVLYGGGADPATPLLISLTFGFAVAAMIYTLGHICGAHFNPAVTLGFAAMDRHAWREVVPYMIAQCTGAILGSAMHALWIPAAATSQDFGATIPAIPVWSAVGLEAVLTFGLMLVIAGSAIDVRAHRSFGGLAIGLYVVIAGLVGGPMTGCSMNPARSLAPALFDGAGSLGVLWIAMVGPVIGAVIAARLYVWLERESIAGAA